MKTYDNYRALWAAVLIVAIRDMDSVLYKREATAFIFDTSNRVCGARWICIMLGLDPDAVQTACMSRERRSELQNKLNPSNRFRMRAHDTNRKVEDASSPAAGSVGADQGEDAWGGEANEGVPARRRARTGIKRAKARRGI